MRAKYVVHLNFLHAPIFRIIRACKKNLHTNKKNTKVIAANYKRFTCDDHELFVYSESELQLVCKSMVQWTAKLK